MNEKFFILKIFESTPLELATVRSLLHFKLLSYVEIESTFMVSCSKSSCKRFCENIQGHGIKFMLIYVNSKVGNAVFSNGIKEEDHLRIIKIVEKV